MPSSAQPEFPSTGNYRQKPCDLVRYANFVQALVERYDGDGVDDYPGLRFPVRYWEVINEPEPFMNGLFFVGTVADYLEILAATYDAIKQADPNAKILNGGMANPTNTDFWERVFSEGALQYIDVLNHHSIRRDARLLVPEAKALFERFNARIPEDHEWWIPEVTFAAQAFGRDQMTTREAGAVILLSHLFALSEGVSKLFYAPLDRGSPNVPLEFYLILPPDISHDGYVKQETFFAYKTMVQNVDHFTEVNRIWEDPPTYQVVRGRHVTYVLFGDFVPFGIKGDVRITDLLGEQRTVPAADLAGLPKPIYAHEMIVDIDVKPGDGAAPINLASRGTVPVAILSRPDFSAPHEVDRNSLTFGRHGNEESLAFCGPGGEDVNEDGLPDLVCHFYQTMAAFEMGDSLAILEGQTTAKVNIKGTDSIRVVGPGR